MKLSIEMLSIAIKLLLFNFVECYNYREFIASNTRYYFYHGSSSTTYDSLNFKSIINNVHFDDKKPTTFYIFGTLENRYAPTVVTIKNAYMKNGKFNFIVVGSQYPFLQIFEFAPIIAETFAYNLLELLNSGYNISKINFVAFSLGSKAIAPLTSRIVRTLSNENYLIPKIVALDPGKVRKNELHLVGYKRLNHNDAEFVMAIHTDCNSWGSRGSNGHVDFRINGGCDQPSCSGSELTKSLCNHLMAPIYWAEVVENDSTNSFESRACIDYKQYLKKECDFNLPVAYIGLYTSTNTTGNYFVRTKKISPYSMS